MANLGATAVAAAALAAVAVAGAALARLIVGGSDRVGVVHGLGLDHGLRQRLGSGRAGLLRCRLGAGRLGGGLVAGVAFTTLARFAAAAAFRVARGALGGGVARGVGVGGGNGYQPGNAQMFNNGN